MASVYILHSKKLNRFYVGSCNDLPKRLQQHKEKFFVGAYTTRADDWELFFELSNLTQTQARAAEKLIKARKSAAFIRSLKNVNSNSFRKKFIAQS